MNPTKIRCPNCGNSILVKQSGKVSCPSCGTALYVEEKDKAVQINVNLGGAPKPKEKPGALLFFCVALSVLLCVFMIFLPLLDRLFRKKEVKVAAKYVTTLTDPVLGTVLSEVFGKDASALTEEDYQRVRALAFDRLNSDILWAKVTLDDASETSVPLVHDKNIKIDGTALQVFSNLEELRVLTDDITLSFSSEQYADTLGNLKKLKVLYLQNNSGYATSPAGVAKLVADSAAIEELGGVTLYDADDVDTLVKRFPALKTLYVGYRGDKVSLSGLKALGQLETLGTELSADGNEDLLELSGVKKMELGASAQGDGIKDFRFLSSLTQLESLTLENAYEMKSLNVLEPLGNLRELRISNGRELRSLEPLRALTGLRSLDIGDSMEFTDLNALSALTELRELRVANSDWSVKGKLPDLSGLTALEELEVGEEDFAQFAACKSLKKLTLFMSRFGDSADFTALAGLDQLEELHLNFDRDDEKPVHIESLSALPALRKLTVVGEDGPLPLGAFPQVTDITVIGNNIVGDLSTDALRIDPAPDGENTALTRLSIIGFQGGIQIGGYGSETKDSAALSVLSHCTALRELRLNHCGLTDLTFVNAIPNVEVLDIVGNRIEDISPLTALSKLRALYCADNDIQNIAVLQGKGILLLE